jgi:hypothetical protein
MPRRSSERTPTKKQFTHGGARPGSGRHSRDTRPITVRLHGLTIRCLKSRNRSADIERVLLDHLIESYSALRHDVPGYAAKIPALRKLRERLSAEGRNR